MEIKILQVFYGKDGLPYKDKDRQVHFPIAGTGFLGASNTTQIKFYYDELDNLNGTTWVAVSKLPNGKIGSRVLESYLDDKLNEHYALLELDSFYTQYKGDVFISLQGYYGGVNVDYNEETSQYEIHGTPTISATGSIKFTINYANQFVGSGETNNVNFQRILADLATKLGIRAKSEYVTQLPSVGENDTFYVIKNDPDEPTLANIYIWNGETKHYIWVGDNALILTNYYTKDEGQEFEQELYDYVDDQINDLKDDVDDQITDFESDVNNQISIFENTTNNKITRIENGLAAVESGAPKGAYANLAAVAAAFPSGNSNIYITLDDGHWCYWNGSSWTDGGDYLSTGDAVPEAREIAGIDLTNDITADELRQGLNLYDRMLETGLTFASFSTITAGTYTINLSSYTQFEVQSAVGVVITIGGIRYAFNKLIDNLGGNRNYFILSQDGTDYIVFFDSSNLSSTTLTIQIQVATSEWYGLAKPIFIVDGSYTVTPSGTGFRIVSDNVYIFDRVGGYLHISSFDITLLTNEMLVLSTDSTNVVNPSFLSQNNGTEVYLIKQNRNNIAGKMVFAFSFAGGLYSVQDIYKFQDSLYEELNGYLGTHAPVFMVNSNYSVTKSGTSYRIVSDEVFVFDRAGGYLYLDSFDITLNSDEALFLSTNSTNVVNPDFLHTNSGTQLYLIKLARSYIDSSKILFALSWGGNLYSINNIYSNADISTIINTLTNDVKKELKGLIPHESFEPSPLENSYSVFNKLKAKNSDVTIVQLGDSISTNNNYSSLVDDPEYQPPRMDDKCLPWYITQLLNWKGQKYRRSDAMTVKGGSTPVFTETADTKESKYYDGAWDWQLDNQSSNYYKLWTRVLTGTITPASVSFVIPAGTKQCAFIYRTDYLCANGCTVAISSGNNKVKAKLYDGSTFVEANGFTFSMKESNVIEENTITDYDGTTNVMEKRISKSQRRLILRVDDISSDITVTIAATTTGRLNYWGIEYSKYEFMVRYINFARGGHNIEMLKSFIPYETDYFKPDLILLQCPVINEGAMSIVSNTYNTPTAFGNRFSSFIQYLKNKNYQPNVLPYVLYIGSQANIVDSYDGEYICSIQDGEYIDTYRYIGALDQAIRLVNNNVLLNFFYAFNEIAYKLAEQGTGNVYTDAIQGSGATGDTLTSDNVHPNDFGSLISYRLIKTWLNY